MIVSCSLRRQGHWGDPIRIRTARGLHDEVSRGTEHKGNVDSVFLPEIVSPLLSNQCKASDEQITVKTMAGTYHLSS